jgi:hypothetical protein
MTCLTCCRWSSCQNLAHLRCGGGGENHTQVMIRPLMMRSLYLVGYVFPFFKQHDLLEVHLKHVSHKNKNKNDLNVGFLTLCWMQVPTIYVRLLQGYDMLDEEDQKECSLAATKLRLMVNFHGLLSLVLFSWKRHNQC